MRKHDQIFIENELKKEDYLLLEPYKNANTPMLIMCSKGHISKKRYGNWSNGGRCVQCKNNRLRDRQSNHSLADITQRFLEKGFILLSPSYKNARQILEIRCKNNHIHKITWNNFQQGRVNQKCTLK